METDRAFLAARIHDTHQFPSLVTSSCDPFTCTFVADALATKNVTLTVTIGARRFDVGPGRWDPAASGTVATVTVPSTDSAGARRHVESHEPEAWARAVFAEFDDAALWIYLLGDIDPDTGHRTSRAGPGRVPRTSSAARTSLWSVAATPPPSSSPRSPPKPRPRSG